MTQTASVHRKNQGKQFTIVDHTRWVFQRYLPGEHLPKLIAHPSASRFLLTQAHVDEARKNQRARLLKIDVNTLTEKQKQKLALAHVPVQVNATGVRFADVPKAVSAWATAKAWGLYAAVAGATCYAAYEITKVLA